MKKEKGLPKVGVDLSTVPDDHNDQGDESSWWSGVGGKNSPADTSGSGERKMTFTEEMENFRHVPVVGRLPWATQYLVFSVVLILSLMSLLFFALRTPNSNSFEQPFISLSAQTNRAISGESVDPNFVYVIDVANQASGTLNAANEERWKKLVPTLKDVPQQAASAKLIRVAARNVNESLTKSINAAAPLWRQAGDSGEWTTVEAVNFAQVLSEIQYLQEVSRRITEGTGEIPDRAATARQNIEQSFRVYASSPASSLNTPLSQAWRALAAGFSPVRTDLDSILGARQQWNSLLGTEKALVEIQKGFTTVAPKKSSKMIWLSALFLLLSGGILSLIGWKQQRWRVLEAQAVGDNLRSGVSKINQHLHGIAKGDLTIRLPANNVDPQLKPLVGIFNTALKELRQLVSNIKQTAEKTALAANEATTATTELIESAQEQMEFVKESGEDILTLGSTIQKISDVADEAKSLSVQANETLDVGKNALELGRTSALLIKEDSDQGGLRAKRLQKSITEMLFASTFLNEVSQQMAVLAIQAGIQASKAGDAGQGFRVVADGLKTLAEKSGDSSSRVGSLVEATVEDIRAMEQIFANVSLKAEETAQTNDVSTESLLMAAQTFEQLEELVLSIKNSAATQSQSANRLTEITQLNIEQVSATTEKAQSASDAVKNLAKVSSLLDQSTHKFKVNE